MGFISGATPILILLTGIAAGFLDSTSGGGGLISIPFLIFFGLPPQVAIATDRLGAIGQESAALLEFSRAKKILWRYVPIFSIMGLVGAVIGANILLSIDPKQLQRIIGILLLAVLPLVIFNKEIAIKRSQPTNLKKGFGFVFYFFIMIYNGIFGAGAGPLSTYNFLYFFGFTLTEVFATSTIPWLLLCLSSLVIFMLRGIVDYKNGVILLIGMTIGGYIGAHVALKKGDLWMKRLFVPVVIASCIKLLFF